NRIADALAARAGVDVEQAYADERGFGANGAPQGATRPVLRVPTQRRSSPSGALLEVTGLRKSFGGVRAVRGVSFQVRQGETLGLIGPNGAGKTTTFELLAGFTRADEGVVRYGGRDITALGPEARGRMGLIRSFQDAALFPTLTVLECVQLSLERVDPTRLVSSLLGLRGQERRKLARAEELVSWMGLDRYKGSQIQELSTGTRRITEIACLVALEPQLLLLDEPSSGVAQKETEALGALLVKLKAELGLTLIIIEHDIPLIMGLSDRIVCMADGEVIAAGTPEHVRHDPAVVEAYLGGSVTAIERSAGHHGGAPVTTRQDELAPHGDELDVLLDDVLEDEPRDDPRDDDLPPAPPRQRTPAARPARSSSTAVLERPLDRTQALALAEAVPGLGAARAAALLERFGSLDAVAGADLEELTTVRGIGPGLAARVRDRLTPAAAAPAPPPRPLPAARATAPVPARPAPRPARTTVQKPRTT
ncbi:MAG: putative transporter ATPase and permease protein, partial [Frankiales bacterium]|nr:putative transporter ATPase and permease protein [Frankiales bacterium]